MRSRLGESSAVSCASSGCCDDVLRGSRLSTTCESMTERPSVTATTRAKQLQVADSNDWYAVGRSTISR